MDYNSSCNLIALRDAKPKRTENLTYVEVGGSKPNPPTYFIQGDVGESNPPNPPDKSDPAGPINKEGHL